MRILHVLDHSVPLQSGYAFRTLAILAEQRARGWETVHLTSPKHHMPYVAEEAVDGWRFLRTKPLPAIVDAIPLVREYATALATARRLAMAVDATRPDILHAHSPVLNAIAALRVGKRRGLPVVYEIRAFWEDAAASHGTFSARGPRYHLARAMETRAVRRADAVTVICDGLRRDLIGRGIPESKVTVIPNAVDPHAFASAAPPDRALAARLGLDGKAVLGFLGSFYSYEGLDLLIEALPRILAAKPEVRVLLVGGGPEDGTLRALVGRLGLADKVVFTGRVPHGEVVRYYALVDVLVYPRISMRLTELVTPLKPLEAMAEGKIVVASDVGGHRELIRDGDTGILFRAGDVAALATKVLDVLGRRDAWPAQRARGRRFIESERSWAASVARYEPVYARLIAGRA